MKITFEISPKDAKLLRSALSDASTLQCYEGELCRVLLAMKDVITTALKSKKSTPIDDPLRGGMDYTSPKYPRLTALGITVHEDPCAHVKRKELNRILRKHGKLRLFSKLFGVQTCYIAGPFPWDCEAVLERMASGRLIGTQLLWD